MASPIIKCPLDFTIVGAGLPSLKLTIERFAETTLLLWNTVTRLPGQTPFPLTNLGPQRAVITVGQPLAVSDRADAYRTNRRQAIATLTQDLQTALMAMLPSP